MKTLLRDPGTPLLVLALTLWAVAFLSWALNGCARGIPTPPPPEDASVDVGCTDFPSLTDCEIYPDLCPDGPGWCDGGHTFCDLHPWLCTEASVAGDGGVVGLPPQPPPPGPVPKPQ